MVPWALDPHLKTSLYCIQDILCDVPGPLEYATNLQNTDRDPNELMSTHQSLSQDILKHLCGLYDWRADAKPPTRFLLRNFRNVE
jgi:hypothetical protein